MPLDAAFSDSSGKERSFGEFFDGTQPVLLVPVYYACPLLCNITLNRMIETLQALPWTPGSGYQIVTISIDPREDSKLALAKRQSYLKALARPSAEQGWHFLTGKKAEIKKVTEAVGFDYRYDTDRMEYLHRAGLILVSPSGEVTRYFHGSYTLPVQLRIGLIKASQGNLGELKERLWAGIFAYDEASRRYVVDTSYLGLILFVMVGAFVGLTIWAIRLRVAEPKEEA